MLISVHQVHQLSQDCKIIDLMCRILVLLVVLESLGMAQAHDLRVHVQLNTQVYGQKFNSLG